MNLHLREALPPTFRDSPRWWFKMLWCRIRYGECCNLPFPTFRDGENGELLMWLWNDISYVRGRRIRKPVEPYWNGPIEIERVSAE